MRLTVGVKLEPSSEQVDALLRTLRRANTAANAMSLTAWRNKVFTRRALHDLTYYDIRQRSGLTAQVVVLLTDKVVDAYKLDHERQRRFGDLGSIAYDDRILSYGEDTVSIWTVAGRQRIQFVCGERQRALLRCRQGQSDLVYQDGRWFLFATVHVEEPPAESVPDYLGVDLGIVNVAVDSDGTTYSGEAVESNRRKYAHRRRNLQRKGTRPARRKLKMLRRRQARYQQDINHCISKAVVSSAKVTARGIALEDLGGIRERTTAARRQRARHSNWAFGQLRSFVEYKARLAGVPVVLVDPRNTSRTCLACGHVDKANRPTQARFVCVACAFSGAADHCAARVIAARARAAVMQPNASCETGKVAGWEHGVEAPATSSRL